MPTEDTEDLKNRLDQAEAANQRLREQLFAFQAKRIKIEGTLFKYRSFSTSLLTSSWEPRYFTLTDSFLRCFPSESQLSSIPLLELNVQGCSINWEGKKQNKFWTFGIKDKSDTVVLRLSSIDRAAALRWISLLESSGANGNKADLPRMNSMPANMIQRSDSAPNSPIIKTYPDLVQTPKKKRKRSMVPSTPVHTQSKPSILSSERLFQHPHPGIFNLGFVILLAANFRLVLENVVKYGFRVNPLKWCQLLMWGSSQPLMLCYPFLALFSFVALQIEKSAVRRADAQQAQSKKTDQQSKLKGQTRVAVCHALNILLCFAVPSLLVFLSSDALLPSFVVTFVTTIVCLKLISYAHCNSDLRRARFYSEIRDDSDAVVYPDNITMENLAYFLFAPTLTYQPAYPRTDRIRWKWLLRRCGELALGLALQMAVIDQYILPAVENTIAPMKNRNVVAIVERVLKLSLPVVYAWLTIFYIFFHLWMNIISELMRFGDREFYKDWWNAINLGQYWKTWNTPMHKWMLRTIYFPAISVGMPRNVAVLLVFFISALLHEVVLVIPLKFRISFPWSFLSMMAQVPLIAFSHLVQTKLGDRFGNIVFWVSFCVVGQPVCLLNYYYDWIQTR